jgi:hypothetical protein
MMNFCGENRKGNMYCLRRIDAEEIQRVFEDAIIHNDINLLRYDGKYSAVNFQSIFDYGSLEFRAMRGNLKPGILQPWFKALLSMREFATKFDNPKDLFMYIEQSGIIKFVREVFNTKALREAFLAPGWTLSTRDYHQELKYIPYLQEWHKIDDNIHNRPAEIDFAVFDGQFDQQPLQAQ